ncbi:MAG: hypothetical protein ACREFL_01305, partial [Stellaceae bacterium]
MVLRPDGKQHVKEAKKKLFREVKSAKMDLAAIGKRLAERKQELMSELAPEAGATSGPRETPSRGAHRGIFQTPMGNERRQPASARASARGGGDKGFDAPCDWTLA